jgi:CheY-like chemotaxis protein
LREVGKGREHRITVRAESVVVNADPARLGQVITNLLDNAVKYTPPGGSIDVDVLREGHDAVLRVTDSGIGIAPELLSRVFDLFVQGERSLDRSAAGLGIGLNVSRRLIEMHGGTIFALSEGTGRGAQFTIRLPLEPVNLPAAPWPVAVPDQSRRVLIIEDNDDARESLRILLESVGHRVAEARDGPRGVALALAEPPDVVLIDLGLPGLDGYDVARRLRSTLGGKTPRLIAVTGYGQAADRQRSKEAGFDAHLVKPVSQSGLLSLIAAAAR